MGRVAAIVAILFGGRNQAVASDDAELFRVRDYAPYCGIFCLYAAGLREGVEIPFADLLTPKYIPDDHGASMEDIKEAAADHGLYALTASNLTAEFLRNCKYPVILHVASRPAEMDFNHYVLCLRTRNDQIDLFDPPHTFRTIKFNDFIPYWDGNGIVISSTPINADGLLLRMKVTVAGAVCLALCMILLIKYATRETRWQINPSIQLQAFCVICASIVVAVTYHSLHVGGLLASKPIADQVAKAFFVDDLAQPNLSGARRLLREGNCIFVDARHSDDFALGHITGAINIPVDYSDDARVDAIKRGGASVTSTIVVYCQSSTCPFSKSVASAFVTAGFKDVRIYAGGWQEWRDNKNESD